MWPVAPATEVSHDAWTKTHCTKGREMFVSFAGEISLSVWFRGQDLAGLVPEPHCRNLRLHVLGVLSSPLGELPLREGLKPICPQQGRGNIPMWDQD